MHLVQLLIPLHDNHQHSFPTAYFNKVRAELTQRFGGVTAFVRSPAVGVWKEQSDTTNRDDVIMFEVLTEELDTQWWAAYRNELEQKFRQEEILIWASTITKL